jgi:HlyD family secretion protein
MERRGHSLRQLERESTLHKKGLVSAEAVDLVKKEAAVLAGEVRSASAQILRAREELQEAKDRLAETEIRAPIAGTVLERTVQPGQIVASGTNAVNGGTTLLKVADLSKMFVRVKVDEVDVARIQPGLRAALTADALAGQTFEGKVARVSPQGKIESNVTVFEVLVELGDDGKRALRPAMTANVEIEVAKRAGAVLVPLRAVRTSKKEGGKVVVVEGQGPRVVQTGIADSRDIEIVGGLQEGERVVLPGGGAGGARDGQRPQGGAGGQNPMRNMRRMMGG